MVARTLAALAEPNRLRIVALLHEAPRAVGEIATLLELRQPQVTKHLHTLQAAGLVTVHPLGQRRIYGLSREPLRDLRRWLEPFEIAHPSEDVLERYRRAIEAETRRPAPAMARTLTFERELPAPPALVWRAWTSADEVRRWWSPRHFTVADCEVDPVPGGRLHIVLQEGDGARHLATGRFLELRPERALRFELAPVGAEGTALFSAVHDLELAETDGGTKLALTIRVGDGGRDAPPEAAPALAGMEPGWNQLLDELAEHLALPGNRQAEVRARDARSSPPPRPGR